MFQASNEKTVEQRNRRIAPRRLTIACLLSLALLLAFAGCASAAPSAHKLVWGPYDAKAFETYDDLGAGLYEITINWARIAPTKPANPTDPADPAYQWTYPVEQAIENAKKHGIEVVLAVSGAPGWANGGRPWRWAPKKPQDYADFVTAASKHWPEVNHWQIWGEPVRRENFMPLPHQVYGLDLTREQSRGPELYARILDAAYVALKAVNPGNIVIGGNTYSGGDIRPLAFVKALRLPNGKPPRMDLYGHNPFGYRRPDLKADMLKPSSGVVDFCDLDVLATYIDKYLSRAGRNKQRIGLFLAEYFMPTDHHNWEFNYWVSRKTAANWLKAAFAITSSWKRIYTLGWFDLYDEAPDGKGTEVNRGLLTYGGTKKPAYYVFKSAFGG